MEAVGSCVWSAVLGSGCVLFCGGGRFRAVLFSCGGWFLGGVRFWGGLGSGWG